MKQLVDVAVTLSSLTCRAEKSGKEWGEEKAATLTLVGNWDGKNVAQLFPSKKAWEAFADAVFDDEGAIKLRIGTFGLDYEIVGGVASIKLPLWDKALEYDLVDVKSIQITPCEGRMCEVKFALNVKPQDSEWEQLVRMLKREVVVCARKAPGGEQRAKDAGQASMPLQQADDQAEVDEVPDPHEQLDAVAGLSPEAAKIVEQVRADEAQEAAESLVPGRKPPQRPKRQGLPANSGAH